jgi:hypothetical protein
LRWRALTLSIRAAAVAPWEDRSPATLERFLRARDYDVGVAAALFLEHRAWRQQLGVRVPGDRVPARQFGEQKIALQSLSRTGRPLLIIVAKRHDKCVRSALRGRTAHALRSHARATDAPQGAPRHGGHPQLHHLHYGQGAPAARAKRKRARPSSRVVGLVTADASALRTPDHGCHAPGRAVRGVGRFRGPVAQQRRPEGARSGVDPSFCVISRLLHRLLTWQSAQALLACFEILQKFYVERVMHLWFAKPPMIFWRVVVSLALLLFCARARLHACWLTQRAARARRAIWKMATPFVAPKTREKIVFLYGDQVS